MVRVARRLISALLFALGPVGITANECGASSLAFDETPHYPTLGAEGLVAADFNNNGGLDLAVANGSSFSIFFHAGPDANYLRRDYFDVGGAANSIAVGYFDGDAFVDVAVTNAAAGTVAILRNLGAGTTFARSTVFGGSGATGIQSGDLNGDGLTDLVVVNFGSTLSVLLNEGNATFAHRTAYTIGPSPRLLRLADLDADGDLDCAVALNGPGGCGCLADSLRLSILQNGGNGLFSPANRYKVALLSGEEVNGFAIGDINRDSRPDVAFVTNSRLVFPTNQGGANFGSELPQITYSFQSGRGAAFGDFNQDGVPDVVVGSPETSSAAIFQNDWDFETFHRADYGVGSSPHEVVVADLNADGLNDLATLNTAGISIALSQFDGRLRARPAAFGRFNAVAAASLDADPRTDVVANGQSITGFLGRGGLNFVPATLGSGALGAVNGLVLLDDVDGDGYEDLFASPGGFFAGVSVAYGLGNSQFSAVTSQTFFSVQTFSTAPPATADFDLNGLPDIIRIANSPTNVVWLRPRGLRVYEAIPVPTNVIPRAIATGNWDGDPWPDVMVAGTANGQPTNGAVTCLRNDNGHVFDDMFAMNAGSGANSVAFEDLDLDGLDDVTVAQDNGAMPSSIVVGFNVGSALAPRVTLLTASASEYFAWVRAYDLDGDFFPELLVGNTDGTALVLRNLGNRSFDVPLQIQTGGGDPLQAADIDNDGRPELLALRGGAFSILRNLTGVSTPTNAVPQFTTRLRQNFPNPFNPSTIIEYELSESATVELCVYNVQGRVVRTLVHGSQSIGLHRAPWDGRDARGVPAASGVYLYRLRSNGNDVATRRMVLVR